MEEGHMEEMLPICWVGKSGEGMGAKVASFAASNVFEGFTETVLLEHIVIDVWKAVLEC